jgi:spermidine synthase
MPTLEWLKTEFSYGYSTGNVLSLIPQIRRQYALGGSYRKVFKRAVLPYLRPDARVLELGPGRGSWTRALLRYLPRGELRTVDFQDVTQWIKPEQYGGRLICYRVKDFQLDVIPD